MEFGDEEFNALHLIWIPHRRLPSQTNDELEKLTQLTRNEFQMMLKVYSNLNAIEIQQATMTQSKTNQSHYMTNFSSSLEIEDSHNFAP